MKTNKLVSAIFILLFLGSVGFLYKYDNKFPLGKIQQEIQFQEGKGGELFDVEGNAIDLDSFLGKVVFINNWASWCPPCIAEMPTIARLKATLPADQVAFVMISFDQSPEKGINWMKKKKMDLPVYFPGENFPQQLMTPSIPTTFILDREGKLLFTYTGMADYSSDSFIAKMQQWIKQ